MNITKVNNLYRLRIAPIAELYGQAVKTRIRYLKKVVIEKSNIMAQSDFAQKLRVAKHYCSVEMKPPFVNESQRLQEDMKLVQEFINGRCYKYLTVKQAWLLFLVCTEVGLWFFLGETIGKMHIIGYKV